MEAPAGVRPPLDQTVKEWVVDRAVHLEILVVVVGSPLAGSMEKLTAVFPILVKGVIQFPLKTIARFLAVPVAAVVVVARILRDVPAAVAVVRSI